MIGTIVKNPALVDFYLRKYAVARTIADVKMVACKIHNKFVASNRYIDYIPTKYNRY